jgi:hypothetical protein
MKFYESILILLVFQILIACSSQNIQGENWVIFSENQARELGIAEWFAQIDETTDYWTPTESEVLSIETELGSFLKENANAFRFTETPVWERLEEYSRQYLGIILGEKKIIYANFFCRSFETDWRKEFVFVLDGGSCFFQFMYDINTSEFFDLRVNGEA